MSDGMYHFESKSNNISGTIQVRTGKFHGENNNYEYFGSFIVNENKLTGHLFIKNKATNKTEKSHLCTNRFDDAQFNLDIPINEALITIELRKAKHETPPPKASL